MCVCVTGFQSVEGECCERGACACARVRVCVCVRVRACVCVCEQDFLSVNGCVMG